MWVKVTGQASGAKAFVKQAGAWKPILGPSAAAGLPGLGDWCDVTATTGSPVKYEYTDADGFDWTSYEWVFGGSVTTTEGLLDTFLVGGGGANAASGAYGAASTPIRALRKMSAGSSAITVGNGAVPQGDDAMRTGGTSSLGAFKAYGGRYGYTEDLAIKDDISGIVRDFGASGMTGQPFWPNSGFGGKARPGGFGMVSIRVPRANAKA